MPRGRKPKALKDSKIKVKPNKDTISSEVQDIFFNSGIKDEEDVPIEELVEEVVDLENPLLDELEEKEAVKEVEAPETVSLSSRGTEDSETFIAVTSFSDEGDEIQTLQSIRPNPPPQESWSDKHSKFVTGQKIMPVRLTKDMYSTFECASVVSPARDFDTYMVKMSRSMNETVIKGSEWVIANKECKPYVSYWEAASPIIKMRKL